MAFTLNQESVQRLAGFVDTPLWRASIKYWWVAVPLGYAAYVRYQERKRKGEASVSNIIADTAPLIGVVATIIAMNAALGASEQRKAAAAAGMGPVSDASFTPNPAAPAEPQAQIGI